MATGSISTLGVGSGLELQDILDQLREVDQQAITNKETKVTGIEEKVEEFTQINSDLLSMRSAALDLSLGSSYLNRTVNASGSSVTATTVDASGADEMSHQIEVTALASNSSWNSEGVSGTTTSIATEAGTFSFKLGEDGSTLSIDIPSGTTLQGLADLINNDDSNPGVTATIADTGFGDNPYKLVLTSDETGEDNRIFIESQLSGIELTESAGAHSEPPTSDNGVTESIIAITTGDNDKIVFRERLADGTLGDELTATIPALEDYTPETLATAVETAMEEASLAGGNEIDYTVSFDADSQRFTIQENGSDLYGLSMEWGESSAADTLGFEAETDTYEPYDANLNAQFTVDSISYQRQSNSNITDVIQGITLDMTDTGTSTISVTSDLSDVKTNLQELVEYLNSLRTEINSNSDYDVETQTSGVLFGETSINRIDDELLSFMGNTLPTGGSITSLYDLGFEVNEDGSFSLDETVLDSVLESSPEDVQAFFLGDSDSGTTGFADLLYDKLYDYTGSAGLMTVKTDAEQTRIDRITAEIEEDNERLDKRYEILTSQYVQLDIYMSQMTAQSEYLTQMFESDSSD